VLPLGLYLITYVLAFAAQPLASYERVKSWAPVAVLLVGFVLATGLAYPLGVVLLAHLSAFFVLCWTCHGELAHRRPPVAHLTRFYLLISVGGVLGGLSGGLVAPWAFNSPLEYPLAVASVAALLGWAAGPDEALLDWRSIAEDRPPAGRATRMARTIRQPVIVVLLGCGAVVAARSLEPPWSLFIAGPLAMVACVLAYSLHARRQRAFALASGALLLAPFLLPSEKTVLRQTRTFFGVHRVIFDRSLARHVYTQGTTIHGLQSFEPGRARVAGAYFHATGPAGQVLGRIQPHRVGLVGLGVGSLATYAEAGQQFTFYEIDPEVARIAADPRLFTYLSDARQRGAKMNIVLGDGRLRLAEAPAQSFDLLVLDAYASDVVPTHLLTREAFALYTQRLAPGGLMLLNVSNRYLDLGRVVGAVVDSLHLMAWERLDTLDTAEQRLLAARDGKAVSKWIIIGNSSRDWEALGFGAEWRRVEAEGASVWTDDYVNIVGALRW
jgi:spermidine synthase